MKRTLWLAGLGLGLVAVAPAQGSSFGYPSNAALRVGAAYPLDGTTRNVVNNFIGVGFDYFLDKSLFGEGETTISIDWLGKSGSGAKGNAFPIMINQRFYNGPELEAGGGRTYWFAGAGVALMDITSSDTVWAIRGGVGKEFGPNIFGELTFIYSDDAAGARATSIGAYVGYRF